MTHRQETGAITFPSLPKLPARLHEDSLGFASSSVSFRISFQACNWDFGYSQVACLLKGRGIMAAREPRKVCIAVDGSRSAAAAVAWAAKNIVHQDDDMRLFTVVPPPIQSKFGFAVSGDADHGLETVPVSSGEA
jgi:hypothetical protein